MMKRISVLWLFILVGEFVYGAGCEEAFFFQNEARVDFCVRAIDEDVFYDGLKDGDAEYQEYVVSLTRTEFGNSNCNADENSAVACVGKLQIEIDASSHDGGLFTADAQDDSGHQLNYLVQYRQSVNSAWIDLDGSSNGIFETGIFRVDPSACLLGSSLANGCEIMRIRFFVPSGAGQDVVSEAYKGTGNFTVTLIENPKANNNYKFGSYIQGIKDEFCADNMDSRLCTGNRSKPTSLDRKEIAQYLKKRGRVSGFGSSNNISIPSDWTLNILTTGKLDLGIGRNAGDEGTALSIDLGDITGQSASSEDFYVSLWGNMNLLEYVEYKQVSQTSLNRCGDSNTGTTFTLCSNRGFQIPFSVKCGDGSDTQITEEEFEAVSDFYSSKCTAEVSGNDGSRLYDESGYKAMLQFTIVDGN